MTHCSDEDEELEPLTVLNPQMQHFFNVLTHRVLQPQEPIPAPAPHVIVRTQILCIV